MDEEERKVVKEALTKIFDTCCQYSCLALPGTQSTKARADLIKYVADQLLGPDGGFEEWT